MSPSLFHKKSKSSLSGSGSSSSSQKAQAEIRSLHAHARKLSTASTASGLSSASHRKPRSIDPLSCHPPLALNTSPHYFDDEERHHEDEERETRFFLNQTHRAEDHHLQDSPEDSPGKGEDCFFRRDACGRMTYVYDQTAQWPLKDWQTIPPGLADIDDDASQATPTPPRARATDHRRRPTEWMDDPQVLIKRGDWKRRGIVFGLDEASEEEQEQHFELPIRGSAYFPFGAP